MKFEPINIRTRALIGQATIDDLSDVSTTGTSDGQFLVYNNTSGEWEKSDSKHLWFYSWCIRYNDCKYTAISNATMEWYSMGKRLSQHSASIRC